MQSCLSSCQPNFTSGCFLGMITNDVLQLDYHIIVMQSSVDVNQINGDFQVFSTPKFFNLSKSHTKNINKFFNLRYHRHSWLSKTFYRTQIPSTHSVSKMYSKLIKCNLKLITQSLICNHL